MFYKQKSNVIFRKYDSFGYITDNRNFGYKLTNSSENFIGDKILSETGAVFFSALEKKPQTLEELSGKIQLQYLDVEINIIENDAREFYNILEKDGFVVSGETYQECIKKDTQFSYKIVEPNTTNSKIFSSKTCCEKDTQDFFEEYFKGKPQLTNLHIEITSKCNERCLHCYIPHEHKIKNIDSDLFYNILEQCKDMKVLHLTLSGGEPMLHKDFCKFLKRCREYNFSVNILTNLTLLDNNIIEEMKDNPLLGVQVSLYSMNPEIHDEITQIKGSFFKTKNAILKLIENNIPLQISCPILKQNKNSYTDVVKWADKYKIHVGDDFVIIGRYDHKTVNLNYRLSIDEVKEIIKEKALGDVGYLEQMKLAAEKKKEITVDEYVCSVCNSSICITENGNIYPCAGWQNYIIGNINKTPLNEIWENSEKIHYLRNLRNKDFPKCIQCPDKDFCTMCLVRNANENPEGNPLVVNEYFCDITRFTKKITIDGKDILKNS